MESTAFRQRGKHGDFDLLDQLPKPVAVLIPARGGSGGKLRHKNRQTPATAKGSPDHVMGSRADMRITKDSHAAQSAAYSPVPLTLRTTMSRLNFTLEKTAPGSKARAARFTTLHGEVRTP